jgi:hypothetical protein
MPVFYEEVRADGQLWGTQGNIVQAIEEAIHRARQHTRELWFSFNSPTQAIAVRVRPNSDPQLILRDYYRAYYRCIATVIGPDALPMISPDLHAQDLMAAIRYGAKIAGKREFGQRLDQLVTLRSYFQAHHGQLPEAPPVDPEQYAQRLNAASRYGSQLADRATA